MQSKIQTYVALILVLAVGCSGNRVLRTAGSETSSGSDSSDGTGKKGTDQGDHDGVVGVSDFIPIAGVNLVEVLVSANCVNQVASACAQVRLSAKVKVNSTEPVRFAADTVSGLGIKSSSWDIAPFDGVTCQTTGTGFDFTPLCTASSGSLAQAKIKATLNLVATDGSAFKGDSPDSVPGTGTVYGNFMLLDASAGFTPSGVKYTDASSSFTQIWQDLVSGLYFTNNLYEGRMGGTTDWDKSVALCSSVDSGGGAGKWHLPSGQELCGSAFNDNASSNTCSDGLYGHGITNVPVVSGGRNWTDIAYIWSSSPSSFAFAWYVYLSNGFTTTYAKSTIFNGVFCARE